MARQMTVYIEQRTTRAAGWTRRAGAFALVLTVTASLAHRYGLLETPVFLWVLGLAGLLALAALGFAAIGFGRFWNHGDLGGADLAVGVVLALIVLAPFAIAGYRAVTLPALSDISTDADDPPALIRAAAARDAGMNPVEQITEAEAAAQARAYPTVTGRRYDVPFDQTVEVVEAVLKARGWTVEPLRRRATSAVEVTIEATASTLLLALPVDVAVRVTDEAGTTYVDMRSAWRYGRHDLGDNAARISTFLDDLDAEITRRTTAVPVG
jgi:hypothetical protein